MKTVFTNDPVEAAEFIKRGGIVAFPTETVYGLGANVFDEAAIEKIFEAKRRPADNPLIAHISEITQIRQLTTGISTNAHAFIDVFFPGPLAIVLPKSDKVPLIATAGLDTIGVRMPRLHTAHEFLAACKTPVVAPSANLSGRPSPTTWKAVFEDLDGRIDCILQGEATEIGLESTVVDCTRDEPMLLRAGAISLEQLRNIVSDTREFEMRENEHPKSPGVRHKHYSPRARVVLTATGEEANIGRQAAFIGLEWPNQSYEFTRICHSVEEYAHSLFEFFRECDRRGITKISCETVQDTGIGTALMDRLTRAADQ